MSFFDDYCAVEKVGDKIEKNTFSCGGGRLHYNL